MNQISKKVTHFAKLLFMGCLALLLAQKTYAQDKIHKKNGKILNVKIIEIGVEDIRYRQQDQNESIIYSIEIESVEKIVLENGLVHKFDTPSLKNPEIYANQRKNALKVTFLAPLAGYTTFSYERSIKPGHSWEAKLGIIGLGKTGGFFSSSSQFQEKQLGAFITGGYKFILSPDYYAARQRYSHILKGSYFRPEISLGSYGENTYIYSASQSRTTERMVTNFISLVLSAGKQWVIDDTFLVDIFGGMGYGGTSSTYRGNELPNRGSEYGVYIENGLAISFGLNIGILIK